MHVKVSMHCNKFLCAISGKCSYYLKEMFVVFITMFIHCKKNVRVIQINVLCNSKKYLYNVENIHMVLENVGL